MKTLELIRKIQQDRRTDKKRFNESPENKEMFGHNDNKPDDFKDKTFLFIRATINDTGARPLPQGTNYWNSPDIELFNNAGTLIPTNQLTENQNHVITVVVNNEGDMTCNSCIVELFICNPSLGFDRVHATQLGIQTVSVLGHDVSTATFNFSPGAEHIGHQCLFARAYSYVSGDLPNSGDGFHTSVDRHIGQQNLSIIEQGEVFEFQVINTEAENQQFAFNLIQNKMTMHNFNYAEIKSLKATRRTISGRRFMLLKGIDTKSMQAVGNKIQMKPSSKNFFVRLIKFLISLFRLRRFDKSKYELLKPSGKNTWTREFSTGLNKVSLDIPILFVLKKRATVFDLQLTNTRTKEVVGGLRVIVKS